MAIHRDPPSPSRRDEHLLDRVVWAALASRHRIFAEGDDLARRYPAPIAPFAAIADTGPDSFRSLLGLLPAGDRIALVTPGEITPPPAFVVARRDSVDQMILAERLPTGPDAPMIALGAADVPEMLALVEATQPGPFGPCTIELGRYIGMRRDGRLIAMAGERMRLDGFTEISAVCVHPAFRGQGLAAALVATLAQSIASRSETPFLHVFSTNHGAIALYRKLGFIRRGHVHLTVLTRAARPENP